MALNQETKKPLGPEKRMDAWENTITKLGTARDKREGGRAKVARSTIAREEYENLYHVDDMAATLVELPAKEMVREWIKLNVSDTVDEDEDENRTEERVDQPDDGPQQTSKLVMEKLDELKAQSVLYEAEVWSRVFGGALIFLGVDDGQEDLSQPLNEDAIRSFEFLQVFDRFEVIISEYDQDPTSPQYGRPSIYTLQPVTGTSFVTRDNEMPRVHASRFIRLDGVLTSRRRQQYNGGWSDSVYIRLETILRDFGLTWASAAHLMQDFSQAIIKMKGLAAAIASDNDNLVLTRMQAMDLCRSVARAIPLDAEDEGFERVATPITGLPELLDRFAVRLSAAARMPVTLLMGMSPAGLNATGESDMKLFYDHIKATQESKHRDPLTRIISLIFAAADGPPEPENWSVDFNPLMQMTELEQAQIRKTQMETDVGYIQNNVLLEDEVASSRFGGDTYSTDTVLDMAMRQEDKLAEAVREEEQRQREEQELELQRMMAEGGGNGAANGQGGEAGQQVAGAQQGGQGFGQAPNGEGRAQAPSGN